MTDSIDDDDVQRWDEKVPERHERQAQIQDYLEDRYSQVAPQNFIDEIADRVSGRRAVGEGLQEQASGADAYYDPQAGQYRDPETGHFVSKE
jgi:hypothetical protein